MNRCWASVACRDPVIGRRRDRRIRRSHRVDQDGGRTPVSRPTGAVNPVAVAGCVERRVQRDNRNLLGKTAPPSKPCARFVAGWCVVVGGVRSATMSSLHQADSGRQGGSGRAASPDAPNSFTKGGRGSAPFAGNAVAFAHEAAHRLSKRRTDVVRHCAVRAAQQVLNSHAPAHSPVARSGARQAPHRSGKDQREDSWHRVTAWQPLLTCSNALPETWRRSIQTTTDGGPLPAAGAPSADSVGCPATHCRPRSRRCQTKVVNFWQRIRQRRHGTVRGRIPLPALGGISWLARAAARHTVERVPHRRAITRDTKRACQSLEVTPGTNPRFGGKRCLRPKHVRPH
jgi:hypothetical protein